MKHAAKRQKRTARLTKTSVTVTAAFIVSLLAFGLMMALPLIMQKLARPLDSSQEVMGERETEQAVWLCFHEGERLTGFVKVIVNGGRVSVVGYPPQTEVIDGTNVTTAAALYTVKGEHTFERLSPLPVLSFPLGRLPSFLSEITGNLPITLPQAVGTLPQGDLSLSPLQVATVLRFEGWDTGGVGQAKIHAEVAAAALCRHTQDFGRAFNELTKVCDTALHISQFEAVREDLSALVGASCEVQVVGGYTIGYGEKQRYVLS